MSGQLRRWLVVGAWPPLCLSLLILGLGCRPSLPADYVQHRDAARAAYQRGDYGAAAMHWERAHAVAPTDHIREEALYRQGVSLQRAGKTHEAAAVYRRLVDSGRGDRKVRADFDGAYLLIDAGKEEEGMGRLTEALLRHPDSGLAVRAANTLLRYEDKRRGESGAGRLLERWLRELDGHEVHQLILYRQAQWSDRNEDDATALTAYKKVIETYPYPGGRYWDEAILRSAELLLSLDNPNEAVNLLTWHTEHREHSDLVGSYERHYSTSHFFRAQIYRDQLQDPETARTHFRTVASDYKTSLLRDDALWAAVLCSVDLGQPEQTCRDAERLASHFPESRYVGCIPRVCPQQTASGDCHDYLMEPPRRELSND